MWKKQTLAAHRQGGFYGMWRKGIVAKIFGNKYICHHTHETAFKIFIAARQSFHKTKVAIVERIITQTHLLIYNCMFGISFGGG